MDTSEALHRQLRWLIGIRLLVVASVVVPYALLQLYSGASFGTVPSASSPVPVIQAVPQPPPTVVDLGAGRAPGDSDFLYLIAGLTSLATLIYIVLLRKLHARPHVQAYVQFFGDLLLVTGLVYYFGGIASPFSMLYLITISVASSLLRRRAGLLVATGAYLLYGGLIISLYFHWVPDSVLAAERASEWRLIYNLAVHLFGFYAVAMLTSYLAENVTQAERELEAQRGSLAELEVVHRDVIHSITSGLVTVDLQERVTSINRAGEEILRRRAPELVGRRVEALGLFTQPEWELYAAASAEGQKVRDEIEIRSDGEALWIGFSIASLNDVGGRRLGSVLAFQDLTAFRALQEELRLKDRMAAVGELAAGLAHEIGNPLAAISGSTQMLATSFSGDTPQRKLLDILLKESQRLDRTIKGFLQFARPRERSNTRFDIARQLAENVALLRNSEEVSAQHRVELRLEPESATIDADPDQISQIFWNLARNSLRAMPGGGTLRVSGSLFGSTYRMEVADTGRGMSEEQRTKLFQPFQSFFDHGTGIGMAIVYRIVHEHGGRLSVDSRPAAGTRIAVDLPVGVAMAQPAPEKVSA
ncbi:MAG: ATP-binding protein [Acidobacteriota bacterium]